jgi:hypothetical protein
MQTCVYCGKQIRATFVECRYCGFSCCSEKCFSKHVTSHAGESLPEPKPIARPKRSSLLPVGCAVLFLSLFTCCGGFLAIGFWASWQQTRDLAQADQLYSAGQQEEAVAIYKKYPSHLLDPDGRGLDALRRVVEFETAKGHATEAKGWIDRALDKKLQVTFDSPAAKQLLATVQQEQAATSLRKRQEGTGKELDGNHPPVAALTTAPRETSRSMVSPQEAAAQAAKEKAEREKFEVEMKAYRTADAEYDAIRKLKLARVLEDDAREEQAQGHRAKADGLRAKAKAYYQDIIEKYPGTQGATDAQSLLDGQSPEVRKLPPLPVPPAPPIGSADHPTKVVSSAPRVPSNTAWVLVEAEEGQLFATNAPVNTIKLVSRSGEAKTVTVYGHRASDNAPELTWLLVSEEDARAVADVPASASWNLAATAGTPKSVLVHGYYRRNGSYVQSYWRSSPGGWGLIGGRRR